MAALLNANAKQQGEKQKNNLIHSVLEASARFTDMDTDGNEKLDFEEFLAIIPSSIRSKHSTAEIRGWFDECDPNGDGVLSINEFFVWSLTDASRQFGSSALETAFKKYDTDKSGYLTSITFGNAARDMGFGAVAHDIFKALDTDGSGTLSYAELAEALPKAPPAESKAKHMLVALAWGRRELTSDGVSIPGASAIHQSVDTSSWVVQGKDAETVQAELRALIHQSGAHVVDVLQLFDDDRDFSRRIDDVEFYKTMKNTFGYKGKLSVVRDVFRHLDKDGNGTIGFDEL